VTVTGVDFEVVFSKADGLLTAYSSHAQEPLNPAHAKITTVPTDVDLLMGNPAPIHKWRAAGLID
jgi:hypothetical protein